MVQLTFSPFFSISWPFLAVLAGLRTQESHDTLHTTSSHGSLHSSHGSFHTDSDVEAQPEPEVLPQMLPQPSHGSLHSSHGSFHADSDVEAQPEPEVLAQMLPQRPVSTAPNSLHRQVRYCSCQWARLLHRPLLLTLLPDFFMSHFWSKIVFVTFLLDIAFFTAFALCLLLVRGH